MRLTFDLPITMVLLASQASLNFSINDQYFSERIPPTVYGGCKIGGKVVKWRKW